MPGSPSKRCGIEPTEGQATLGTQSNRKESRTTKKILAAAGIGAALIAGPLVGAGAATATSSPAHADMISTVGNDSANTTCQVLAQDFTGRVSTDTQVLVGVDAATVQYYNITPLQAAYVINYQVANFCPACGPTWSRSAMPHAAVTGRRSEQDH